MTTQETTKFLGMIAAAYPERFMLNEYSPDIWSDLLQDIPVEKALAALKCHIASSPFVPTIADIRKHVVELNTDPADHLDAGSAWELVLKAVVKFGLRQKQQALESLPIRTQQAVHYLSWEAICNGNPEIIRSQFVKAYQEISIKKTQQAVLPQDLQKMIKAIG